MKTQLRWISSLFTALAVLALAGCQNPADDVAEAQVSPPNPAAAAPAPNPTPASAPNPDPAAARSPAAGTSASTLKDIPQGAEVLAISPETSRIEFVGSKVTGSHSGGFKTFQGTFALLPEKPESSRIAAQIDMNSTYSDNERLTGHLKSPDFFDVAKHPSAVFETTEIKAGAGDPKAKDATHAITGNLTLHGVTKSIQFPARIAVAPDAVTLDSEFSLNRKDFGISYPGMANDLIREQVVIKLAIRAPRGKK